MDPPEPPEPLPVTHACYLGNKTDFRIHNSYFLLAGSTQVVITPVQLSITLTELIKSRY